MTVYKITAPHTEAQNTATINASTMTPPLIAAILQGVLEINPSEMEPSAWTALAGIDRFAEAISGGDALALPVHSRALGLEIEHVTPRPPALVEVETPHIRGVLDRYEDARNGDSNDAEHEVAREMAEMLESIWIDGVTAEGM